MDGFKPVGSFGAGMEGYFGWLAHQGFPVPKRREDIWLPEGTDAVAGATHRRHGCLLHCPTAPSLPNTPRPTSRAATASRSSCISAIGARIPLLSLPRPITQCTVPRI